MITVDFYYYLTPPLGDEPQVDRSGWPALSCQHSQKHCRHQSWSDEGGGQVRHRARAARGFHGTDVKITNVWAEE